MMVINYTLVLIVFFCLNCWKRWRRVYTLQKFDIVSLPPEDDKFCTLQTPQAYSRYSLLVTLTQKKMFLRQQKKLLSAFHLPHAIVDKFANKKLLLWETKSVKTEATNQVCTYKYCMCIVNHCTAHLSCYPYWKILWNELFTNSSVRLVPLSTSFHKKRTKSRKCSTGTVGKVSHMHNKFQKTSTCPFKLQSKSHFQCFFFSLPHFCTQVFSTLPDKLKK